MAQSDSALSGDIVVTAQKRSESAQSVPIAITAVTAADLVNRSASTLSDIVTKAPNIDVTTSSQGGSNAGFTIRGIGQTDFISTVDPGVGVYLDGVYIARTAGAALDLLDIDRVEVLRGPQGTLFGKNAVGGAISIYTAQPNAQKWEGSVLARAGENGRLDVGATLNVPIVTDRLALRLSGLTENQDGYAKSLYDGHKMNGTERQVMHGTLRWTPASNFWAEIGADYTHVHEDNKIAIINAINSSSFVTTPQNEFATANGIAPYDNRYLSSGYANYSGFNPGDNENIWGARLTLNWDFGNASLKSISAYRHMAVDTGLDFDGSPDALGDQTVSDREKQISQELTLTGKAFGDRLDYAIGGYYLDEKGSNDIYLPLSFVANPSGYDTYTTNDYHNKTEAVYGQATFHATDKLSLTAGGRYSHERKADTITTYATKLGVYFVPTTPQSDSWNSFTWRLAAEYQFNRDIMAYASAATGFKSGGFNGRAQSTAAFLSFDPEKARTYEVGIKTRLFDRHLLLNADVFQTDYDNVQTTLNVVDPVTHVTTNVVGNPGDARIRGVEIEGQARFDTHFSIDFGAGYLHGKYTRIEAGADIDKADKLPETPKWTINVGGQYVLDAPISHISDGQITARVDYSYKSSVYFGAVNSIYNYQKGYSLVNTRLSYGSSSGGWSIAFYGKNVFNKYYNTYKNDLLKFVYALSLPAPPRELGVELRKKF